MAAVLTDPPRVGISACVYDCPVRYNGKAFDALAPIGREKGDFVFTPVCPECMAGLGVPRTPIHLTGPGQEVLAGESKVRDRHGEDVTERVLAGAEASIAAFERAGVEAVIVKEASPTCGVYKARIGKKRRQQVTGSGVFGAMLLEKGWFLIPDDALQSPIKWWDWRRRLHAFLWLKRRPLETKAELYDAWHTLKFVVQEIDRKAADDIGRRLAGMPKRVAPEDVEAYRGEILGLLRRPSTPARIRQSLWKAYKHHEKHGRLEGKDLHELDVRSPEVGRNVTRLAEQVTKLERVGFEQDMLFGTTPVIYRAERRVRKRDEELR
jgi:uncharacterized protein YbbK (DUF523 family)